MKTASSRFFHALKSATAPRTGPAMATMVTAIVVAHAKRAVASADSSPLAA